VIPVVMAMACLLFIFGHAPVAGHEGSKLVGGLGAALIFAAAGAIGAWAAGLVSLGRLALFAGLFAVLGLSFNLALHPAGPSVATADFLQGLALCGLGVACWRRCLGAHVWGDALLVALPLLASDLLAPIAPEFPGSQYLIAGRAPERSLFPLLPWLTMAALGAWAVSAGWRATGAAAVVFGAAQAVLWRGDSSAAPPVKFPVNLAYALLSCAAVAAAFTLARGLTRAGAATRGLSWLGRNWLVFFYVHFAIVYFLRRQTIGPAPAVWAALAAGSLAATWLAEKLAAPFSGRFQSAGAWVVPLALIAAAGLWPRLHPAAVSGLAGAAGLIFAAYHARLAYLIVNFRPGWRSAATYRPAVRRRETSGTTAEASGPGPGLARLAVIVVLLLLPEMVGLLMGTGTPLHLAR
jgi:hypothetical protein